jgi:hypothetical protein
MVLVFCHSESAMPCGGCEATFNNKMSNKWSLYEAILSFSACPVRNAISNRVIPVSLFVIPAQAGIQNTPSTFLNRNVLRLHIEKPKA